MQVEREWQQCHESGGRVRNAYATCLMPGGSPWKRGLIPRKLAGPHGLVRKAEAA